jgi:hypothetical protein
MDFMGRFLGYEVAQAPDLTEIYIEFSGAHPVFFEEGRILIDEEAVIISRLMLCLSLEFAYRFLNRGENREKIRSAW